jgi:putative ABC transport system permease protein
VISDAMTPADRPMTVENVSNVSAGFFATLGVPLAEGRDFEEGDRANGGAMILSTRAARILFPHGGAVGHTVRWGGEKGRWLPVVGVARDFEMYFRNPDGREPDPPVFVSVTQRHMDGWGIVIRPRIDDPKLALALHAVLRDALPPKASAQVRPWSENYELQIRGAKFFADLFGFIATAAMLLGAAGLFSVLSYAVSQRMREFAVRSALGAERRDILVVVLKYALEMSLAGTAIGAVLSFWASSGVSSFLFGVKNTDPVSLVVAELVLLSITMGAALIPAIRATRADPVEVLRAS